LTKQLKNANVITINSKNKIMNHDSYRPHASPELRKQAVESLQASISQVYEKALFDNLIEDDVVVDKEGNSSRQAVVLIRDSNGDILKLFIKGSSEDGKKEFSIENFSRVGEAKSKLIPGRAVLRTDNPGVLLEDHLSASPRLIDDVNIIQRIEYDIQTATLLTPEEKETHRAGMQSDLANILGLPGNDRKEP